MKTVNLELSKKLQELGFDKIVKPYLYWLENEEGNALLVNKTENVTVRGLCTSIPTWTADEVIDALPKILSDQVTFFLTLSVIKDEDKYGVYYVIEYLQIDWESRYTETGRTLSDASAAMMILLIKNGLVEVGK